MVHITASHGNILVAHRAQCDAIDDHLRREPIPPYPSDTTGERGIYANAYFSRRRALEGQPQFTTGQLASWMAKWAQRFVGGRWGQRLRPEARTSLSLVFFDAIYRHDLRLFMRAVDEKICPMASGPHVSKNACREWQDYRREATDVMEKCKLWIPPTRMWDGAAPATPAPPAQHVFDDPVPF